MSKVHQDALVSHKNLNNFWARPQLYLVLQHNHWGSDWRMGPFSNILGSGSPRVDALDTEYAGCRNGA